jgi:maleylacetoacetate isomerase
MSLVMLELHSYWRSSASYRVRSALNLKRLPYKIVPVHLARDGGEQHSADYRALNPQELVPTLRDGDFTLSQSIPILQYLEELHPEPALAPTELHARMRHWSFCQYIACELQPLQNLRVLNYLTSTFGISEAQKIEWLRHWFSTGLAALEQSLPNAESLYCFGDTPTYADCCLVPHFFACDRFGVDVTPYPRLLAIVTRLRALPEFIAAHPNQQADAPPA